MMNWVKRFRTHGIEGLLDQPGRGAKPYLPPEHQDAFKQSVLELQQKKVGGRIRGVDVLELMKEKFNIEPTLSTIYNMLEKIGLVWITGRSIHSKSDVIKQEDFKKNSEKR